MGIILPAFVIIFFTFEFGNEYKFKVGIIDKDNSYASEEIVKVIDELEDVVQSLVGGKLIGYSSAEEKYE